MGCDLVPKWLHLHFAIFQSTHPYGVRQFNVISGEIQITISIHAPVWGATTPVRPSGGNLGISIHAPVWGATTLFLKELHDRLISIHAPVWGATFLKRWLYLIFEISIHAPVWGATLIACAKFCSNANFNPRTRMGCDARANRLRFYLGLFQSTHPYGVRPELSI